MVSLRKKEMMTTTNFGMQLVSTVMWTSHKLHTTADMGNGFLDLTIAGG